MPVSRVEMVGGGLAEAGEDGGRRRTEAEDGDGRGDERVGTEEGFSVGGSDGAEGGGGWSDEQRKGRSGRGDRKWERDGGGAADEAREAELERNGSRKRRSWVEEMKPEVEETRVEPWVERGQCRAERSES